MSFTIKRNGQVIKTVERENKLRNMNGKENQVWMSKVNKKCWSKINNNKLSVFSDKKEGQHAGYEN